MIDLTFLEKLTKGDIQKMKKYISMYLSVAPEIFERMRKSLHEENWSSLALNAHSIKPQTDYMGIESLKQVLMEIEYALVKEKYHSLTTLFETAFELHEKSQVILNDKFKEL
ncbi:MAG: HPt (histidine-containing phosphotransfer) domain-containing protein [Patiriisocius sp.]|jgi:HPt (histidine-containing phosphotransfer) domain-containing protein